MPTSPPSASSSLLLEEHFESGNPAFLGELFASSQDRKLAALADKWVKDTRPFAREMMLQYVDDGCDRRGHRPLVKRLFKHAEAALDDELMGHFLVAFDHLTHRRLLERTRFDWQTRERWVEQVIKEDKTVPARFADPSKEPELGKAHPRFSRATRRYLQRRAFRYFRRLGYREPARYVQAMLRTLPLYTDALLTKPIQLLDAWGLVHALYGRSAVLERTSSGIHVKEGRALKELVPAPMFPDAWRGARDGLIELALRAHSRTVRSFAVAWVQEAFSAELGQLPLETVRRLIRSEHPEVQTLGVRLLERAEGLDKLPVAEWVELLQLENAEALPLLTAAVRKFVSPSRFDVAQCVALAKARFVSVAELGLSWLEAKPVASAQDVDARLPVLEATCAPVRVRAAAWLGALVTQHAASLGHEAVRAFVDSEHEDVRAQGLALMEQPTFASSTVLWTNLSESPHHDVRAYLLRHLAREQEKLPAEHLRHLWATTLLSVHRGGRGKGTAALQVADRIVQKPAEAAALLPLLALTLRSIRGPERRLALSTLLRAVTSSPALRPAVAAMIPELQLFDAQVSS